MPLVSFCISTYKRPEFIKKQLQLLSLQTYRDFEVIISDNDEDESAKAVTEYFNDNRFKYFANKQNLGMIKSFNKSIERATSDYIVMITDDDPLEKNFLYEMMPLTSLYPDKSLYGGFRKNSDNIEVIEKEKFPSFVLDPVKNPSIFWSNCILKKADVVAVGKIPDYGSPHLSDHALLAMTGSIKGGVIKNKIYSSHFRHDDNYSKSNLDMYYIGCIGFYRTLNLFFKDHVCKNEISVTLKKHLRHWFMGMSFTLQKIFYKERDMKNLEKVNDVSKKILSLKFMKNGVLKFKIKRLIFFFKSRLGLL